MTTTHPDRRTVDNLLKSDPGMLWRYAKVRGFFAGVVHVRDNGTGWEVFLAGNKDMLLNYTYTEFAGCFELVTDKWTTPEISDKIGRAIFSRFMDRLRN